MKKTLIALTLAGLMCVPAFAAETTFTDVPDEAEYAVSVNAAAEKGLMVGDGEGSFNPEGTITAAQLMQTLYNLAGNPEVETEGTEWYAKAIAWAEENGISADAEPAAEVTLAEIADAVLDYAEIAHLPSFADREDSDDAIAWCVNAGIIAADADETAAVTRAEFAGILVMLDEMKPADMTEYIAEHEGEFFLTGKISYTIQDKMVSEDTYVYNELEDVEYTASDDGISVVLKGTAGEEWVAKLEKVLSTYTKPDGTALTEEDFTANKDTYIDITTTANPDTNFACYVPADTAVEIQTS